MDLLIEWLKDVSAGDVLQWVMVVVGIIAGIGALSVRLYKVLENYRKTRNKAEEEDRVIREHTESIMAIREDIGTLVEFNKKMVEVNKIQTRNSIVRICNEALDQGFVDSVQLQALEDSYDMYVNILNGNSYVSSLVAATRRLRVAFRGNSTNIGE